MIIAKVIYDEKNGLWYELQGDYYIPCLKLPEEEQQPIGIWGQRHLRYIKQNRKVLYLNLLTSGNLNRYLSDLDKQAEEMFSRLVKQMAEREGVTEQLKAVNQMEWVARMNNIRNRAKEVVNTDIVVISQILCKHRFRCKTEQNIFKAGAAEAVSALSTK